MILKMLPQEIEVEQEIGEEIVKQRDEFDSFFVEIPISAKANPDWTYRLKIPIQFEVVE